MTRPTRRNPPAPDAATATPKTSALIGKALVSFVSFVALVAATVASVSAAILIVYPELKPREKLGAELDKITVETSVTFGRYAREADGRYAEVAPENEMVDGLYLLVHANLLGYEERSYSVKTAILDSKTRSRVDSPKLLADNNSGRCETRSPNSEEDGLVWRCWLAAPRPGQKFIVRVELTDAGDKSDQRAGPVGYEPVLDFIESTEFTYP